LLTKRLPLFDAFDVKENVPYCRVSPFLRPPLGFWKEDVGSF
jgi:hypothetical protein